MAKTSKTMLNSNGESGHPCLVPDFRGNAFNFLPLRIMFAVGLSCIALIMLRYVLSIPALESFESVLMRWMKLEPIIQSEVSQKEKHQYSILTHIYGI